MSTRQLVVTKKPQTPWKTWKNQRKTQENPAGSLKKNKKEIENQGKTLENSDKQKL